MSTFNLNIETDNEAFKEGPQALWPLLESVGQQLDAEQTEGIVRDVNGNTVGSWKLADDGQPIHLHGEDACIVIVGGPAEGFQFVGPFQSHWEADKWTGDQSHLDEPWWIAPLAPGL